jgi:pyridoxamine 5'-phosphate oxidase
MDPIREIREVRELARQAGDVLVDVCYLATVAAADRAEVRALSLRDITDEGFGVLINRTSPKWAQLTRAGRAMLMIHWPSVRRQYRVWGHTAPMAPDRIEQYWNHKSHGSRLLEHYYSAVHPQSHPIPSHAYLMDGIAALARRYPRKEDVPLPETLEGAYLLADEVETWHGSPEDRLHHRRRYQKSASGWTVTTLVP